MVPTAFLLYDPMKALMQQTQKDDNGEKICDHQTSIKWLIPGGNCMRIKQVDSGRYQAKVVQKFNTLTEIISSDCSIIDFCTILLPEFKTLVGNPSQLVYHRLVLVEKTRKHGAHLQLKGLLEKNITFYATVRKGSVISSATVLSVKIQILCREGLQMAH